MARTTKRLDRKALILVATKGRDSDGGPDVTYSQTGPERHCHREDVGGRESRVADSLRSEASAVFTFNWFAGLNSENRLFCEGHTYDIVAPPVEIGRRIRWEVIARERPAQTSGAPTP